MSGLDQTDIDFDRHEDIVKEKASEWHSSEASWEVPSMLAAIKQVSNGRSQSKAADDYEFAQGTLSDVINDVLVAIEEYEQGSGETAFSGAGPGQSPFETQDEDAAEYVNMDPGEFIKSFFEDFEVGVRQNWIAIQAKRADRHDGLPTKDSLKMDLLNMSSGISESKHMEAEYIADEYWAEAQKYLQITGRGVMETGKSQNTQVQQGSTFVSPSQQQQHGVQQGGQSQQGQLLQMMMQQIQEMQRELQDIKNGAASGGGQSTVDRLEELQREKELLEQIAGGDDDRIDAIEEQIQTLAEQFYVENERSQQQPAQHAGSLQEQLLAMTVKYDDVELPDVLEYLDEEREVEKHPEVLEKEHEKEIREMEIKSEQDRYERIGSIIEKGLEQAGKGLGESIVSGGEQPTQSESGRAESTGSQRPEACPECGTEMQHSPAGSSCVACGYGVAQCDLCSEPVEIPPVGDADHGQCPQCGSAADVSVTGAECRQCDWTGDADEIHGELLECGGCGQFRPIDRTGGGYDPSDLEVMMED